MKACVLAYTLLLTLACGLGVASPFQYGDVFVSAANGNVYRYNPAGTLLQTISAGSTAYGLSFDGSGNLYVATGSAIKKFDSSGNSLGVFASGFPGIINSATDIDFDSAGNAYVVGIQDLNFDFVRSYSSSGSIIGTGSFLQGQENWVYADYAGNNTLLVTPGTTSVVARVSTSSLSVTGGLNISNGGPNGDVESLPGGGFLVITGNPIDQYDSSGNLVSTYNTVVPTSGTWIGVDRFTSTSFWATSDFGEVREFNLGTGTPVASFNASVNARGLAVFTTPEPSTGGVLAGGVAILGLVYRRRHNRGHVSGPGVRA